MAKKVQYYKFLLIFYQSYSWWYSLRSKLFTWLMAYFTNFFMIDFLFSTHFANSHTQRESSSCSSDRVNTLNDWEGSVIFMQKKKMDESDTKCWWHRKWVKPISIWWPNGILCQRSQSQHGQNANVYEKEKLQRSQTIDISRSGFRYRPFKVITRTLHMIFTHIIFLWLHFFHFLVSISQIQCECRMTQWQ